MLQFSKASNHMIQPPLKMFFVSLFPMPADESQVVRQFEGEK